MIVFQGVGHTYRRGAPDALRALEGVSFTVDRGEFVSIVGSSGCGKSTLLKLVGDLLVPDLGTIIVDGMGTFEARKRRAFSYVFQNPVLLPWRDVEQNISLPSEISGEAGRSADELLELVNLRACNRLLPAQLSGGMQQRVALARALSFRPKVLLMDEPFGALDELTREALNLTLLSIWNRTGVTVLFVTHSLSEAVFLSDRVLVMGGRPGRLVNSFEVEFKRPRREELLEEPAFHYSVRCLRKRLEDRK